MRHLVWFAILAVLSSKVPATAAELTPLVDCSLEVYRVINQSRQWTGKSPDGCQAEVYVGQRADGIFVTAWNKGNSEKGWVRLSLSSAMGYYELANRKALEKAGLDIRARAVRIGRCLDSIIRVNDPLECRDYATKTYSAGDDIGIENKRTVWLDDNGRHSVVGYDYGGSRATAVGPPADLFGGPALPPGTSLNIHVFDSE